MKEFEPTGRVDFGPLATWVVAEIGRREKAPLSFLGAWYYTGTPVLDSIDEAGVRFLKFLQHLRLQRGYSVHPSRRVLVEHTCSSCGHVDRSQQEKQVDTGLSIDLLAQAVMRGFEIAVIFSGDADMVPAVEAAKRFGARVYVAHWGFGLSSELSEAAFDRIDLRTGYGAFAQLSGTNGQRKRNGQSESDQAVFLRELACAQRQFRGGYVGVNHFLQTWDMSADMSVARRRTAYAELQEAGIVVEYGASDGNKAMKINVLE